MVNPAAASAAAPAASASASATYDALRARLVDAFNVFDASGGGMITAAQAGDVLARVSGRAGESRMGGRGEGASRQERVAREEE